MNALILWLSLLVAIVAYMTLWFLVAKRYKRYDVVDSAWGLGFAYVAWLALAEQGEWRKLHLFGVILVSLWGLRLFVHISRRNWGKPEDKRYTALRTKWGTREALRAYTNIFLLQGVLILLISTPIVALVLSHGRLNGITLIGFAVWVFGIGFEALADYQLARFLKARVQGSRELMQRGLWRYSRHPNYFGEVMTWCGASIVSISLGQWWGVVGAIVITLLITKISGIPLLEKHYASNKDYEIYKRHTSVLVPWPPKP